jgi:type II secretion system (T2SS) protein G
MQIELRQREEMRGPAADGLLLGLWIGEVLGAAEYWLLRGASAGLGLARQFFLRPLLLSTFIVSGAVGFLSAHAFAEMSYTRARSAVLELKTIENGALLFRSEHARWPTRLEELVPRYLRALPADPWAHGYALFRGEGGMAIVSAGPDGELGTGDDVLRVVANPILSGLESL